MGLKENLVEWFAYKYDMDLTEDAMAMERITQAAEKATNELRTGEEVEVSLPFITATDEGPLHLYVTVTREWLGEGLPDTVIEETLVELEKEEKPAEPPKQSLYQSMPAPPRAHTDKPMARHRSETFKKDSPLFSMKFIIVVIVVLSLVLAAYFFLA